MEDPTYLKSKLMDLRETVKRLEETLDKRRANKYCATTSFAQYSEQANKSQELKITQLRDLCVFSRKASGFKIEQFYRKLRLSPGELYVYDCWMRGATISASFEVKFCETVLGPGDECGSVSQVEAEVKMTKDDPEDLSKWVYTCANAGDIPLLMQGLVEFSNQAQLRRSILKSLYERMIRGQLGSYSFQIEGIPDNGVMIAAQGADGSNLFSITWGIGYSNHTKSMISSFDVNCYSDSEHIRSLQVLSDLKQPYLKEEVLSQLWEELVETLICST